MLLHSRRQGLSLADQDGHQARFYEDYRKVAEEYDREFLKNYDEDLSTTLIFVSLAPGFPLLVLIRASGWSIFCSHLRIHYPGRFSAPA